jgi:hypothetical protein
MQTFHSADIKDLSDAYLEFLLADLPSEEDLAKDQAISRRFIRRMDRLVRENRRIPKSWKRMLLVAALVGTILAAAVSTYAYREAIAEFFITIYEKYSEIVFPTSSETSQYTNGSEPAYGLEDNLPSNIPAGYQESDRLLLIGLLQITYTDDSGNVLLYDKSEQGNQTIGINTEGVEVEEIIVNEYKGLYYSNLGQNSFLWADGVYVHRIIGIIAKEDIIDMVKSTK